MSSLKKTLKYYFNEIKVVASRSRALIKETSTVNDISLLCSVIFPFTLSFFSTFKHFPFFFFFGIFFNVSFPDATSFRAISSHCSVPKYSLTKQVKFPLKHWHKPSLNTMWLRTSLSLHPSRTLSSSFSRKSRSFTSPCNSLLCPFASPSPLWKVLACQACVKFALLPSAICFV